MSNSSLLKRVYEHAKQHPSKVIVHDRARTWTWLELMEAAMAYSYSIRLYASKEEIVPIIVDRTGNTVAAMLGCLFAGKCFATLSMELPFLRIEQCILKANTDVCIDVSGVFRQQLEKTYLLLDKANDVRNENISADFLPEQLLYVLFTSGSTGEPKAVKVSASNIENTMLWSMDMIDWQVNDVMGCASQFSFDISMFDFFSMLYFNVPLAIFSNVRDYRTVLEEINRFEITSIFSVPQFFSSLLNGEQANRLQLCSSLRRILSGGDFFNPVHLLQWRNEFSNLAIYNVWGPTETSIVNTMHLVNNNDIAPLHEGRLPAVGCIHERMPFVLLNESRTAIVDKPFEQGEITMLGDCVTQGYLNDIVTTQAKYGVWDNKPCFFTEDLAYLDENNRLFIVGRMGTMVKIAGFRVDLNEIEFVAASFENIKQCCCIVLMNALKEKQLQMVCTLTDPSNELSVYAFKTYLRERLAPYMIPKRVHVIPSMPLNLNQKIDRKALTTMFSVVDANN
jgi:acyl-coenzyme A synthetase/AMP-(fatty) acid ligase